MKYTHTSLRLVFFLLTWFLAAIAAAQTQQVIAEQNFDGGGLSFVPTVMFNDGSNDHFNQTDGTDIANISGNYSFENGTNQFWAAEDTDDNGGNGNDLQRLLFSGVSLTGFENITICLDVAAGNENGPGASAYDQDDFLRVYYSTDIDTFSQLVLSLAYFDNGDNFNEPLHHDVNLDGVGNDGPQILTTATTICGSVPAVATLNANLLNTQIWVAMDATGEEVAFDNFQILGTPTGPTQGNQPPNPGPARIGVELRTSTNADCPQIAMTNAVVGGTYMLGDLITIAGIGVPVPTPDEVEDDRDPDSELFVTIEDVLVTTATCTTQFEITYTITDTEEATSSPRTDVVLVIDDTAPQLLSSNFMTSFSLAPGACPADVRTLIDVQAAASQPGAPGSPLFTGLPVLGSTTLNFQGVDSFTETCSDEQTEVTWTILDVTYNEIGCNRLEVYYQTIVADACGNEAFVMNQLQFTQTEPVVIPSVGPLVLTTSAGINCLDPFAALTAGMAFAPGATVPLGSASFTLPEASAIMGCLGPNPTFTYLYFESGVSTTNPCLTEGVLGFSFATGCAGEPPLDYLIDYTLVDDTAPVVLPPAAITIDCNEDPFDLAITGEATATDNCQSITQPLISSQPVWINEFHYDNAGSDVNEFVEVAGAAGTSLAGYALEFVNGLNGAVYRTEALSGTLPDEGQGYGAIALILPSNGLQNGAPDGIALCGPGGVIEFLSYEGTMTASTGCASGLTSSDVGVEESSATGIGSSIQRVGTGTMAGQFSFVTGTESPGQLNVGQLFPANPGGPTGGPIATTFTDIILPGNCSGNFIIERTFSATDDCGNVGTASQIITVQDTTAPVFNEPVGALTTSITTTDLAAAGLGNCALEIDQNALLTNINFAALFGQSNYLGLITFPTAADNCSALTTVVASSVSLGASVGSAPCSVELILTFSATDECFNESNYEVRVLVNDNEAPILNGMPQSSFAFECDMPFDTTVTGSPVFTDNCGSSLPVPPAVWINEFHYDNAGSDVNEFIEVAGTAGYDLAGHSLVLYNGSNSSVYNTVPLSGIMPDEGRGAGAIAFEFPPNGLQNGAPDGIALVDAAGTVIEFLSYEGGIAAQNGPALGLLSIDVGVSENSTTAADQSLQRVGGGSAAAAFTFIGPALASPGVLNANQFFFGQSVTVSFSESAMPDPTCPNGQTITRTFVASDGCGNTSAFTQTIVISDTQAPEYASFPMDTTIDCSSLADVPSITELAAFADGLGGPVITDNCSTGLVATSTDALDATLNCPSIAVFTRSFDPVDDGCGNILPARTLTITVIDTTAPVLLGLPDSGDYDCSGGVPPLGAVQVEDCDPAVVFTEVDEVDTDNSEGLGFPGQNGVVSVTRRTYTATDQCGLTTMTSRVFRVLDLEAPVLVSCPEPIGPIVARPDDRANVNYPMPVFTDNCAFSVSASQASGTDFPVGITTVVITALDEGGNETVCTFTVEVVKALNIACTDNAIAIPDAAQLTRADINFPFASTVCSLCPNGADLPNLTYLGYFQGHEYYVSEPGNRLSWQEANSYAFRVGGRLVQIDSEEENRFLQRELPYDEALIGLVAPSGPGSWVWTDDDNATTFRNWAPGAPANTATEVYGVLRASDGLHVDVDASHFPYIIEFDCINFEVIGMPEDSLFDAGLHAVEYVAMDRCGNRDTCVYTFNVSTFDVNYCQPGFTGPLFPQGDAYSVTGVEIGAFAKTFSLGDQSVTTRDTVCLTEDVATPLVLSAETSATAGDTFAAYWRVWVDANRDGDFYDAGELIFQAFGDAQTIGDITLPSSLGTLSPTRIRVAVNRYTYPEPCGNFRFGDFKDFSFRSDVSRQPLLQLRGSVVNRLPVLITDSEEDDQVARYLLLRGETADALSKIERWMAAYQDGELHTYAMTDGDPLQLALYQAVALDAAGFILRRSNIVEIELPSRKGDLTFELAPNPASDFVDIIVPEVPNPETPGQVELYDALGRKVVEQVWPTGTSRARLRLGSLPSATYFIRVVHPDVMSTVKRVVVEQGGGSVIVPRV